MAITKRRLYSADASVAVREGAAAADAGTWTPEDEGTPDDVILDAREWETVRIYPEFTDGAGAGAAGTSVQVTPLIAVRDERTGATAGRRWIELAQVTINDNEAAEVSVNGHLAAVRLDAVTLGAAADVGIKATGGKRRTQEED